MGTYKGWRQIAVLLHQEARRRGLDRAKQVVFIGDGAAWVWEKNYRLTFPGAVEILDFYHASEHVGQLAAALYDDDLEQAALCRSRWCHDMKQTSPAAPVAECRSQLAEHPEWSKTKREAMELQINYLKATPPAHVTGNIRPRLGDGRPRRKSAPPDFFVLHPS